MKNSEKTKKRIFNNSIAWILIIVMLIGTTYAWFTDSVTSGKNKIIAGNVDIGLKYKNSTTGEWVTMDENSNIFKTDTLWEPGHMEYAVLEISNLGDLSLDYNLGVYVADESGGEPSNQQDAENTENKKLKASKKTFSFLGASEGAATEIKTLRASNSDNLLLGENELPDSESTTNADDDDFRLSDYMKYSVVRGDLSKLSREEMQAAAGQGTVLNEDYSSDGTIIAGEDSDMVTLFVFMPKSVGNEANGKTGTKAHTINLGIKVFAEQHSKNVEEDTSYLTFSSDGAFTLSTQSGYCYATGLEASTDKENWSVFKADGDVMPSVAAVKGTDDKYYVYLRGNDMTALADVGSGKGTYLSLTPEDSSTLVDCSGNIMTLLDHENPDEATMGAGAFAGLFANCDKLRSAPTLPATELADYCYLSLFQMCTSLETAPSLPATKLTDYCYYCMFSECESLKTAPTISATELANYCCKDMFYKCTSLEAAPTLQATVLADHCYADMFYKCTSLKTTPTLPATILADGCYSGMFEGCTSLKTAPALPATTLADGCYSGMFWGCEALTAAPSLPVTELKSGCYQNMFRDCKTLKVAPTLSATTLANYCYENMFCGCTSLTTAPTLPATTLATQCYNNMFCDCTSLTAAPALPATELAVSCYATMFKGCTSLTAAPVLPAETLAAHCYSSMFESCTSLKISSSSGNKIFTCPTEIPDGAVHCMFYQTNNSSFCDAVSGTTYYWYTE